MFNYLLHYKAYLDVLPGHVFLASFLVFVVLNIFENLIHYSIGRTMDMPGVKIKMPTKRDWWRIIMIMMIFAILQALLTCVFTGCLWESVRLFVLFYYLLGNQEMSKSVKLIREQKEEYMDHMFDTIYEPLYRHYKTLYQGLVGTKEAASKGILKTFQKEVAKIPEWNQLKVESSYKDLIDSSKCHYFPELLKTIYVLSVKMVLIGLPQENRNKIQIKVPAPDTFYHRLLIHVARELWKRPYLFYHQAKSVEQQNHLYQFEIILRQKIRSVIRETLPIDLMVQQMSNSELLRNESESESEDEDEEEAEPEQSESDGDAEQSEDEDEQSESESVEELQSESESTAEEEAEQSESESESETEVLAVHEMEEPEVPLVESEPLVVATEVPVAIATEVPLVESEPLVVATIVEQFAAVATDETEETNVSPEVPVAPVPVTSPAVEELINRNKHIVIHETEEEEDIPIIKDDPNKKLIHIQELIRKKKAPHKRSKNSFF